MKKVLFIASHRRDRAPGQRFRFEQYIEFLGSNGFQCDISPILGTEDDDKVFYSPGRYFQKIGIGLRALKHRFQDTHRMNEYDIIFICREAFMTGSIFFEKRLRKSRAKLIYDFDDAIWMDVVSENNKVFAWLKDAGKTSKIIELCDLIFAGNQYLADYAKRFNPNVSIVPTTIDTNLYLPHPSHDKAKVVIGWSGSISTIWHFRYAIPALHHLKEKFGERIAFKVIGDPNYRDGPLSIIGVPWKKETELPELRQIDIGIMPLPNDEWTRGKCGLKGLQYMALEIPCVMSNVGVNCEIIMDGINGFLASSTEEWVEKISQLIINPELRKKLGKEGRRTVIQRFSVESQKQRYLDAFIGVLQAR